MGSICNISHVNVAVTNANILKYKKKKKKKKSDIKIQPNNTSIAFKGTGYTW